MGFPLTLLDLAGAVALLLWSVHMVQTGVQRAFGARLRAGLSRGLRTRGSAFLAGAAVTAVLQSSTATGLMVTGFAAGGLVDLVPALAVMLGANVGSTLIVQALSFDVASIAPALVLIGVMTFRRASAGVRDLGRVFIGLGLMLMALRQLLVLATPFEDVPSLRMMLGAIATEPVLDVVLAAGITWAAHSSVAVVLLVMSLCAKGVVPPVAAFALVLGANLGTAINPVLEGSAGADAAARRVPLGNLLVRLAGVVFALPLLGVAGPWMVTLVPDNARAVADFHTLFNLALAAIGLPLLTVYAKVLVRMLPARVDPADPGRPMHLDASARETPWVALGGAAREALRLADVLQEMLAGLREALVKGDRRQMARTRQLDDVLDKLNAAIKAYLTGMEPEAMTEADHRRMTEILVFITNLEHAGDVIDRNLLGLAAKKVKRGIAFPSDVQEALLGVIDRLEAALRIAGSLLVSGDAPVAAIAGEHSGGQGDGSDLGEFHRIVEQLAQEMPQAVPVTADHRRQGGVEFLAEHKGLRRGGGGDCIANLAQGRREIEPGFMRRHATMLEMHHGQDVVDNPQQLVTGLGDQAQISLLLHGQLAARQQFGNADDAVQRRAQFVGNHGEEFGAAALGGVLRGDVGVGGDDPAISEVGDADLDPPAIGCIALVIADQRAVGRSGKPVQQHISNPGLNLRRAGKVTALHLQA